MSALPMGWVETTLGELGQWGSGGTPKSDMKSNYGGTIPWIRSGDLPDGPILEHEVGITQSGLDSSSAKWVPEGSVLVAMYGATIGKLGISTYPVTTNQAVAFCTTNKAVEPRFLFSGLAAMKQDLIEMGQGGAQPNISQQLLKAVEFPLPPLPEQQRIVAKVDALMMRTARARKDLAHIPTLITRYKQRLLALAFSGELTADWRAEAGEPRIWQNARLEELAKLGTGSTPKRGTPRFYAGGTIPWVTSGVVNDDVVSEADQFITPAALKETNCKVFPAGTLLVAMYGEGKTRGKVTTLGIDAATNQALAAIQNYSDSVSTRYLFWFLKSNYLSLRDQAVGGVQPNLSLGLLKKLVVPFPTLPEQTEIVRRIETAFAWLDRLAAEHTSATKLLPKLDAAILTKAFAGHLVPQNPTDEPASILLARVKAEREAMPAKGRKVRA